MRRALRVYPGLLALLLVSLVSACGWQLAGAGPDTAPLGRVLVRGDAGTAGMLRDLVRQSGGAQLVPGTEAADVEINILEDRTLRRIIALSGGGRVREIELVQVVRFDVRQQSRALIAPNTVEFRTQVSYDDAAVLSKTAEIATLVEAMQRDAAVQILRRIDAVRK